MTSALQSFSAHRRWLVLILIAFVVVAAGCGGSDDSEESSPPLDLSPAELDIPVIAAPTLRAGDCFGSAADLAAATNKVDCGSPHTLEVFSFNEVADTEFPGADEIDAQAAALCEENFLNVKGAPSSMSLVETLWAVPTESTWGDGDRYINCAVRYPTETAQTFAEFNPMRAFGLISIFGLETGDCFPEIDLQRTGARPVSCDAPHGFEVYAVTQLPDGDYPGDAAIAEQQNTFCGEQLAEFLGGPISLASPQALFPDAQTWAQQDRQISCLLLSDPMVEGSLRGTGDGSAPAVAAGGSSDAAGGPVLDGVETDLFGGDLSVGNWISVSEMTSDRIAVKWDGVDGATSYDLSRIAKADAIGDVATWTALQNVYSGPDLSFVDQSVTEGSEYIYVVTASGPDFTTNAQWRTAAAVNDTTAPSPVGSVSTLRTDSGLLLQWNESTDNYRFAVYEVFRGIGDATPEYYNTVWAQDKTAFVDEAPPASGDVTYQILALDLHGNESERSSVTYTFG